MMERLEALREAWAGLSAREQRLLGAMGAIALALSVGTIVMLASSAMDEVREERAELREALTAIDTAAPRIEAAIRKKEAAAARYDNPVGPLGSYLERKAEDQELELRQVNEQPDDSFGKYTRRHVRTNMSAVGLGPMMRMIASLYEGNRPVAVEQIDIQHYAEGDRYNVELGVYAFEGDPARNPSAKGAK